MSELPVLYSFRRCPYAIRARMALAVAGITVELREVLLRDKPVALLEASAKGTVPVLVLADGRVIDESLAVMDWALKQQDPAGWADTSADTEWLINHCDGAFKGWLDKYKYADRHPEHSPEHYREQAEVFLAELEQRLGTQAWLGGHQAARADVAVFPFVRQFVGVDPAWWQEATYPKLRCWLDHWLVSEAFTAVMAKYPRWQAGAPGVLFPER
jgi:glutathione S-transferase